MVDEILEHRMFAEGSFRRAGVWKSKSFAEKRANAMREAGWLVRTVVVPVKKGIRFVNYRK